jgi:hypothetical protein
MPQIINPGVLLSWLAASIKYFIDCIIINDDLSEINVASIDLFA